MVHGSPKPLTAEEKSTYEWQMWVGDFGEAGQVKLKAASVMVSRCGGVGGTVAYWLAAAGVGELVLAHAGNLKPSDLNRQILMTHDWLDKPRIESASRRLKELNPRLEVRAFGENVSESNARRLTEGVDAIVSCAPLFEERLAMNAEAVRRGIPLVDCAMYELEAQVTTIIPGRTPCLACLYPQKPPAWKRQFPVFGAVAGAIGAIGAMEAIKLLAGFGEPLAGRMMMLDLRDGSCRRVTIERNPACAVCSGLK